MWVVTWSLLYDRFGLQKGQIRNKLLIFQMKKMYKSFMETSCKWPFNVDYCVYVPFNYAHLGLALTTYIGRFLIQCDKPCIL